MKHYLFTDGACSGNPGPGGYAWALVRAEETQDVLVQIAAVGHPETTTNQKMELTAAIAGLKEAPAVPLNIVTDSAYLVNGISLWLPKWKENDWLTRDNLEVKNEDLWRELDSLLELLPGVYVTKVKGHSDGNTIEEHYNRLTDHLARIGRQNGVLGHVSDAFWKGIFGDAFKPLKYKAGWQMCPRCKQYPWTWEFDNGMFAVCLCMPDSGYLAPARAESVNSWNKRRPKDIYPGITQLRQLWNTWAGTGKTQNQLGEGQW